MTQEELPDLQPNSSAEGGEIAESGRENISPEGVDRSLIRWMLTLTPTERLQTLQGFVDGVAALRNARPT